MKQFITLALSILSFQAFSQSAVDSVMASVERNNTTLSAYRKSTDALKIGNKTGLFPANPEVEFNYLWGTPSAMGDRTDFSVRQSFDFPSAYTFRNRISDLKNEQAELEYQRQRRDILLQARLLCVQLTYRNALLAEYSTRLVHARQVAETYKRKFESGETGVLEYNKAQIHLLNVSKDLENLSIERQALSAALTSLNGGTVIEFAESVFASVQIAQDFGEWYAQAEQHNPVLQWLKEELAITRQEQKLKASQGLPGFFAGYMSEKVVGQQFQGVTMGVTIPLWENRNSVKYVKAKAVAVESMQHDSKLQFYNEMKALHAKAVSLQNSINDYRQELMKYSNHELLSKSLEKGEISLGEYFFELSLYYESIDKLLGMELSLGLAYGELLKFQ